MNNKMDLCQYKDIFGKPKEGLHKYRIMNIAMIDLLFTAVAAYLLSHVFSSSFLLVFIILIIMGIVMHKLFCVDTTINNVLFKY